MEHQTSSQRMAQSVARSLRHWRSRGKEEPILTDALPAVSLPPFTIAISRQAGTNGSGVAQTVGERLGWPVYDRGLIEEIADQMGLHTELVESVDERKSSWLEECLRSFSSGPDVTQSAYVHHLVQILFSLAAHGQCVIVGRGAAQVLPEATTLRVRLVAPFDDRVVATRERFGLSVEEAQRKVRQTDDHRARFVRDHFLKDPDDPALYDLILNACRLNAADCAEMIVATLEKLKKVQEPVRAAQRVRP
jgi:cytidylate kinase